MLYNKIILIIAAVLLLGSCQNPGLLGTDDPEPLLTQWVFVDSTEKNTCAIDSRHQGYCWGVGLGNLPRKIPFMEDISAVRIANVNGDIFYVIKSDGSFRRVTRNGDQWFEESFIEVPLVRGMSHHTFQMNVGSNQRTCAVDPAGAVWCFRESSGSLALPAISRVEGLPPVVQVDTGLSHSCALTEDGAVWCWGNNASGQLGRDPADGTDHPAPVENLPACTMVRVGNNKSCSIAMDQHVYCWGRIYSWSTHRCFDVESGDFEPCENPDIYDVYETDHHYIDSWQPTRMEGLPQVKDLTPYALDVSGGIWWYGWKKDREPERVFPDINDIVLSQGTCFIRRDHSLWCWGWAGEGGARFGIGEVENQCDARSCWFYSAVPLRVHEPVD